MNTTPLRAARLRRELTLKEVSDAIGGYDLGNLSRIERGEQQATPELAAKLADFFGHQITEMQILYPQRYLLKQNCSGEKTI